MKWLVAIILIAFMAVVSVLGLKLILWWEDSFDVRTRSGLCCKYVALVGYTLLGFALCIVPADVYGPESSAMSTSYLWQLLMILILLYLLAPFVFSLFFHRADSASHKPYKWALIYTLVIGACIMAGLGISYAFLGTSKTPIYLTQCVPSEMVLADEVTQPCTQQGLQYISYKVSFLVYVMAVVVWSGSWVFSIFGGIGIVALPVALLYRFVDRPRPADKETAELLKSRLRERAEYLSATGRGLKSRQQSMKTTSCSWRKKRTWESDMRKFKQSVHMLEMDYKKVQMSIEDRGENPAVSYAILGSGIFGGILSCMWILQIFVVIMIPWMIGRRLTGLLDDMMIAVSDIKLFILELLIYAILTAYLMTCVVYGTMSLGMRLFFWLSVYPIVPGQTPLKSVLINIAYSVISAAGVLVFTVEALKEYTMISYGHVFLYVEVWNLTFFGLFYQYRIFVVIFIVFMIGTSVVLYLKPRDEPALQLESEVVASALRKEKLDSAV